MGTPNGNQVMKGKILMLEPRRLAAKAAASRLATNLMEPIGQRVGYSIRHEKCRSEDTQIEVLTDGLFLKRLQADPALEGVTCVIFDEFHERRRDSDIALAMLREARPHLNPELRLLLMSATLNLAALKNQLPEACLIQSMGKTFPVTTTHQAPRQEESLPKQVLRALEQGALPLRFNQDKERTRPSILVFLPGIREILWTLTILKDAPSLKGWELTTLHGQQSLNDQTLALRRCSPNSPGKIILATSIAESSLTIEGIALVIDSGLSRQSRFDPNTGMEGLETVVSSLDSADQRRGRAGRHSPGDCIRLWPAADEQRRPLHTSPEILRADPLPIVLELATWGAGLGGALPWIDAPAIASLQEGQRQLIDLNALDRDGHLTDKGRQLNKLGVHPRLGCLLLQSKSWGCEALGADLAAVLSEQDPLSSQQMGCDLMMRLDLLRKPSLNIDRSLQKRLTPIQRLSDQLLRQLNLLKPLSGAQQKPQLCEDEATLAALLISKAFPEWLALERADQPGCYHLRQGRGARLPKQDTLSGSEVLAVARVDLNQVDTVIRLALPLAKADLRELYELEGEWMKKIAWDKDRSQIRAERVLRLGALSIQREPLIKPPAEECRNLLLSVLRHQGLSKLPWGPRSQQLRNRMDIANRLLGAPWPQRSLSALTKHPETWLQTALLNCMSFHELKEDDLIEALWGHLPWERRQQLSVLLPERINIPSGRCVELVYADDEVKLSVKLQEMFGCKHVPHLLNGQIPVVLELLSPAGRPIQRTKDLEGFWAGSYQDVCREMRGRYPKHPWPDDPISAKATRLTHKKFLELEKLHKDQNKTT